MKFLKYISLIFILTTTLSGCDKEIKQPEQSTYLITETEQTVEYGQLPRPILLNPDRETECGENYIYEVKYSTDRELHPIHWETISYEKGKSFQPPTAHETGDYLVLMNIHFNNGYTPCTQTNTSTVHSIEVYKN